MFVPKRYVNDKGESVFVVSFNGTPAQNVPPGFKEAVPPNKEASKQVLERAGLGSPTAAEDILKKEGLSTTDPASTILQDAKLQPKEDDTAFKQQQDVLKQTDDLLTSKTDPKKEQEELKNYLQSTEPPTSVTSKSVDHLTTQLKSQYKSIQNSSGYRYKNEKELDSIYSGMAAKLAANGINDLRDIGVEEVEIEPTTRTIKNVQQEDGKYFYIDYDTSDANQRVELSPDQIKDLREVEEDMGGGDVAKRLEADILEGGGTDKFLINKITGKRLQDVAFTSPQFRTDLAANGEFSTDIAKFRGDLKLEDRKGFTRWGKDLSVDGQADYAIEFVDGNAVMMPVWKDTKTDLTPLMMMASAALMAYGVPGQIGGSLAPAGASVGAKAAIGNAVIAGGMTAISGGDLEDIAKSAVMSGGMAYASAYVPSISKSIGNALLGEGAPGSLTVGTAVTNAGLNGIAALLTGQDPKKAMLAGAVTSAVQLNASDFLKTAFGEDVFSSLSKATNLSDKQLESLVVRSISRGAGAMAYNKSFFTGFRDSLVTEGLSLSAANAATKGLANNKNLSKEQLGKIHKTVRNVSKVAITAKRQGLNPSTVLQSIYPKIILDTFK